MLESRLAPGLAGSIKGHPPFRQRFITLNVKEDAAPESVGMELASLFRNGSELVP